MSKLFEIAQKVVNNKWFNNFIFLLILLSAIVTGIETYPHIAQQYYNAIV